MFTNPEEIDVPDVADNFLSGTSWCGAGLLCHPSDQLPISCLITELTDFTNSVKIYSAVFGLLVSWVFMKSNSALASSPAFFAALEARSQAPWPSSEAQGSSSLASPPLLMGCAGQCRGSPGLGCPMGSTCLRCPALPQQQRE